LEVGGRYQITQLYFSSHGDALSVDSLYAPSEPDEAFLVVVDTLRGADDTFSLFPLFSTRVVVAVAACDWEAAAALLKSKAVPGVFGVLAADPNEEKAPDPRPNAAEAPPVGDDIPAVVRDGIVLKGLERPP
jgi:hypothetical protein